MNFWGNIWFLITAAAIIGGGSIGSLGVYMVGMRLSFIGIVISHAAMAGGVLAYLLGLPVFLTSLGTALLAALVLGWLLNHEIHMESDVMLGILFSLMMGLIFLGMGIVRDDMTPLLGLMWGSLLFVKAQDLAIMVFLSFILVGFLLLFHKEMKSIVFSRTLGIVCGLPVNLVTIIFLVLSAGIITANLNMIGGLLIYSLLSCPAASAYTIGKNMRAILILSSIFGMLSAGVGLAVSFGFDLPTGACITLTSVFIYGMALLWRKFNPGDG
ncbi:metal ABC transporter permease [Candidatus Sumerlaeota bacterium]|nr:metal ABC transporter permease [Candidatus Sumerlaeota bacterium]